MSNEIILPVEGYEHYETEYIDDMGFRVHAKRPKPGFTPEPEPAPADPEDYKAEKFALEAASGGRNTLLFDDLGLPRAKFNNILLEQARFTDINLKSGYFGGMTFEGSYFGNVDMKNATFENADFSGVHFRNAVFTDAVFEDCKDKE